MVPKPTMTTMTTTMVEPWVVLIINAMKMKAIVTPIVIVLMVFFVEQIIALRDSQMNMTAAQKILIAVLLMLVRINNMI